ncbi:MAG TPA: hypothetical protein VHM64_17040 [Candidatus Binatia bacterium]|nr:hypothetical protein [Candidatus Binatia bacterium]
MEKQNQSRRGNILVLVCLLLVFIGLIATAFVPTISDTTHVLLLGGGLFLAGVLGRSAFKQG